jgi:hypothetical protein
MLRQSQIWQVEMLNIRKCSIFRGGTSQDDLHSPPDKLGR